MMEDEKKKIGRPKEDLYEKYVAGKEDALIEHCENGADLRGLAEFLGCGLTTVKTIKKEYPKFQELVSEANKVADEMVESCLYKRAIGYDAEETITEERVSEDGSAQTTYVRKVKKHIPPDTTAQIFWLKNRMKDKWRDQQDFNLDTNQPIHINIMRDES